MRELFMIIWLFPVLFMIHDFEEIIMINVWQQRNKQYIQNIKNKYIPYDFSVSTEAFSIGVAEEFFIISIVTIISYLLNNYIVWIGLFIAFVLHFFFHIFMCINLKKYVPGVLTSIIFILPSCFMLYRINSLLDYHITMILFSALIGTLIMMVNIYTLHKAMKKFDYWLKRYSTRSTKNIL